MFSRTRLSSRNGFRYDYFLLSNPLSPLVPEKKITIHLDGYPTGFLKRNAADVSIVAFLERMMYCINQKENYF